MSSDLTGARGSGLGAARPFPFLLLPSLWAVRNRTRRRERGDLLRGLVFGGIGLAVIAALVAGSFWVTYQAIQYAELGDYLIRIGLSWLFLTFLSFLAFSGVVSALATFFLSDDLRLVMVSPVAARRVFMARFARTVAQSGWMVVVFLTPVLAGVGFAKCAPWAFVAVATFTVAPFVVIPVGLGAAVTLLLVNVFPARRARDILMLMGLLFATSLVILLRVVQPERLLRVESMPVVTDFFATLQSPVTPLLPSFWAGEAIFAGLHGGVDWLHLAALWTTAAAVTIVLGAAFARWHFRRLQQVAGGAQGALRAVARPRRGGRLAADLRGAAAAAGEGRQGVPARRQPVVAAAAAGGAGARLSLQLPRARSRSRAGDERRHQERLRLPQHGHDRFRDGHRHGALRVSGRVGRGRGVLDHPHGADLAQRLPVVEVLDRAGAGARS